MKNLYIIRGLPGSGKSTIAKSLGKSWQIFEADQFFMKNGKYEFDGSKLKDAHDWCKRKVHNAMHPNLVNPLFFSNIVISNTFTQEWEMKPYIDLANQYGYTIFTIVVENRHGNSSVHNVPEETINKMKNRFEIKL